MRFVNNYFNDAANAAVAFFHRGFVAVVSSRYKKKKSKYRAAIIVVWYCLFLNLCNWFIQVVDKSQE